MNIITHTLRILEQYNSLIKFYIKDTKSIPASERKIEFGMPLPDLNSFKSEVLRILENEDYTVDFVRTINQLYILGESNSDLLVEHPHIEKILYKEYPIVREFESLSFGTYEFIRDNIFRVKTEYDQPILYKGFEDIHTDLPEYQFKDNQYILWQPYRFIFAITDAYANQQFTDFNYQKKILTENKRAEFTQQQKAEQINNAIKLSTNFCDRNFVCDYILESYNINKEYIIGYILSDLFEKLNIADYGNYIQFDFDKYHQGYDWKFEKNTISDYPDLVALPQFEQLILLLSSVLFVNKLDGGKAKVTDALKENKQNGDEVANKHIDKSVIAANSMSATTKDKRHLDCITKLSLLTEIHEEFNTIIWQDISLLEFLNVFAETIQKVEAFQIKDKTQFYYLLKRIWRNRTDKSTYKYEKEWLIPFLNTYDLSHSSYSNQFIEKDGVHNHRKFISTVADIFPDSQKK